MGLVKWPILGAIFDIDGTVLDSMYGINYRFHRRIALDPKFGGMQEFPTYDEEWKAAYNAAYAAGGLSGTYGRYGRITPENFHDFYPGIEDAYARFIEATDDVPTASVGGDDVADAVRTIWRRGALTSHRDNRLRLAINTTKEKRNVKRLLEHVDLWQYFDTCVTLDDVVRRAANGEAKRRGMEILPESINDLRALLPQHVLKSLEKPNAYSSEATLRKLGLPADRVVVFEDTVSGVQSAKWLDMPHGTEHLYVVGVTWGDQPDPDALRKAGADEIITTPSQMVGVVERFGGFS